MWIVFKLKENMAAYLLDINFLFFILFFFFLLWLPDSCPVWNTDNISSLVMCSWIWNRQEIYRKNVFYICCFRRGTKKKKKKRWYSRDESLIKFN